MRCMTSNPTSQAPHLATELATEVAGQGRTSADGANTGTRRITGAAWIVGGALWMSAGLLYAESGWRFRTSSAIWLAADVMLAAGLMGLRVLRPHGPSRSAALALVVVLVARMLFAAAEASALVNGTENELLLPVAALLTALSSIGYGTFARNAPRRLRSANIALGLYFFVAMLPFLAVTGEPNSFAIAGWGVPALLIGLTINLDNARHPISEV